jgi:hypothetical protein
MDWFGPAFGGFRILDRDRLRFRFGVLHVRDGISGTGGTDVMKRYSVTSRTRQIGFDPMVDVLIGTADVLPKCGRVYEEHQCTFLKTC